MTDRYTGGPAFPTQEKTGIYSVGEDGQAHPEILTQGGMTLRDWFAGQAGEQDIMQWISIRDEYGVRTGDYRSREQAKYAYADAMLEARK